MLKDTVIAKCAPTMAGLKTANLFGYPCCDKEELYRCVREINLILVPCRLRLMILRYDGQRALLYLFRPAYLRRDLTNPLAAEILSQLGYPVGSDSRCIAELQNRMSQNDEFPHEIGLFGLLDSCVFAGASYATWRLCWRLLFEKTPKSPVLSACLAGTNPGTSGAFCGANPKFCESED